MPSAKNRVGAAFLPPAKYRVRYRATGRRPYIYPLFPKLNAGNRGKEACLCCCGLRVRAAQMPVGSLTPVSW